MNKKKFLMIASVIFIIGVIGSLFTHRSVQTPISEEKSFDSTEVSAINIEAFNATVEILPTDDEEIKVTLDGTISSSTEQKLNANIDNSTINISFDEQQTRWFNFDFTYEELTLTVYLPEKEYDSLKVYSDNGKVSAEQLTVANINIRSDNGRIQLEDIVSQSTNVESDNGKITLDNVEGDLIGKSSNGSITLLTEVIDRNIDFSTDNGSIKIETEAEPTNVQFAVSVDNGSLNLLDKYQGNAVIGDGENLIRLSADNGSISVTEK